ncbi:alpha/beta fold hydrolase [Paenibacillus aurantiacus]|uniref:Alpha/beta fold hydrolase n=1 Tax=Paenibacillus aurantiacus TaxID=1936118 RepID=A0ABV5KVE6_9BACL
MNEPIIKQNSGKLLLTGLLAASIAVGSLPAAAGATSSHDLAPTSIASGLTAEETLVPLRAAAEDIAAIVRYDGISRTAIVTWAGHELRFPIGKATMTVDGRSIALDKPLRVDAQGRLLLSLSAFNEALGIESAWSQLEGLTPSGKSYDAKSARFVRQLARGQWDAAAANFSKGLTAALPRPTLEAFWAQVQALYGGVASLEQVTIQPNAVHTTAKLLYKTERQLPFALEVRFDADGRIDDLIVPAMADVPYSPPSYDLPQTYKEEQVVVGEGTLALPGKLTVPSDGRIAAVAVLVHGSGPNDEDETAGAAKTFRDLAVGLAKQGVATLRYTKRTREHSFKAVTPGFTVKDETIDDALLAADLVNADARFADVPVILVGHSQGGMLVPRILKDDRNKRFDAAVILAGPTVPIEDLILTQYKNAVERARKQGASPEVIAQLEQQAKQWEQTVAIIKDERYTTNNYPADLPLPNASWWFDFRNHYAAEQAKDQHIPLFIAQGDNDVQVDASNLEGWKKALSARTDVTYKLYPKLNHVFVPYDQPSTGAEYMLPGNVPIEVMEDLAAWMKQQPAK